MKQAVLAAALSVLVSASALQAGPTTAPASMLDAIRNDDWAALPQQLKMQSASAGRLVEPDQAKVASWIGEYRDREARFAADRRKSFDAAVRDTRTLTRGNYPDLALDSLADAYALAPDKPAFLREAWVTALVRDDVTGAEHAAAAGEWLKARQLYSNLSIMQPKEPKWTASVQDMVRRMRILSSYAPDVFAGMLKKELEYHKAARHYLVASTQPAATTQPGETVESSDDLVKNIASDWKQQLGGVKVEMLNEALQDARQSYYKDVKYDQLLGGGLKALRTLCTTPGIDHGFASLGDKKKKAAFLDVLNQQAKLIADRPADQDTLNSVLNVVSAANLQTVNLPDEVLVYEFADGAFGTLDPFSSMIWPSDTDDFRTTTQGEFAGVGIEIKSEDGLIKVISPMPDSPALKAGIRADDTITAINGKSAKGITTMQAKRQIVGEVGSDVTLTVRSPGDKVTDYRLTRQVIKVAAIKGWDHQSNGSWNWMVDPDQKIAYVRLSSFTRECGVELDHAVDEMHAAGARAIILDLRNDPGGLLPAAGEVADKFLSKDDGKIVTTQSLRDLSPESRIEAHTSDDDVRLPMVVLVNAFSASASEIVSGALSDLKRATIVGERSFGKGSVQMLFPLEKQTALLKLTTSHWYTPSGRCVHREENSTTWGVEPQLKVEMTPEQSRKLMDARTDLDVLRDGPISPEKQQKADAAVRDTDLQLDAAVLVLRLQLAAVPGT